MSTVTVTFQLNDYPDDPAEMQRVWEATATKLEELSGGTVKDGGTHDLDEAYDVHGNTAGR